MRNIIIILMGLLLFACNSNEANVAHISGKIKNYDSTRDSVKIYIPKQYQKLIAIDKDGSFSDTLNVAAGRYMMQIGNQFAKVFLDNKDKMSITADYKNFDETLQFDGNTQNVKANNVAIQSLLLQEKYFDEEAFKSSEEGFNLIVDSLNAKYVKIRQDNKNLEPKYWKSLDADLDKGIVNNRNLYNESKVLISLNGQKSPGFSMRNTADEIIQLKDFKGRNVYIDVWATWCGPCKKEIPALLKLEEEYKDKNLEFISISIDEPKSRDKWKKFVQDKNLKGTQLMAESAWQSEFVKSFQIKGIPRFILLDTEGKIIMANAPRPSGNDIKPLLDSISAIM